MIEIQGQRNPRKTQEIFNLCNLVRNNIVVREKFGIENMQKFQKFLRTRSFRLITSAVKALEHGRFSHQIFDDWRDYNFHYNPPELQVVKKEPHPSRQLHFFPAYKGAKEMK